MLLRVAAVSLKPRPRQKIGGKEHIGIAVIVTLASQRDAFARQTTMLSDLVSKAKGEDIGANDSLGIADAVSQAHGDISAQDAGKAVDELIKANLLYVHAPEDDLRIAEWRDAPIPVLVVKERHYRDTEDAPRGPDGQRPRARALLIERGHLAGEPLHRCVPMIRRIVEGVTDQTGVPLELSRYLTTEGLRCRGNLPLDEEAGAKLALLFRLQDRVKDLDRVELIAHRVRQFTREEATYWLSRTTSYGPTANRWALSGLRTMLGGQAKDTGVQDMLERLRLAA